MTHILIIDDDEISREILAENLVKSGFDVASAASGEEAVALLRSRPIPIVICDWEMPGMSGLEVCRWIRSSALRKSTYIIMLTARGMEHLINGIDSGADAFLTKPFDIEIIIDHIRLAQRILAA